MSKAGKTLVIIGILCIAAALALVIYNGREAQRAELSSETVLSALKTQLPPVPDNGKNTENELPQIPAAESEIEYPDYVLDPNRRMPVISVKGNDYIGVLSVPALELELPIMSEWSYPALATAPCRYCGSPYTDSLILCAHNYPAHFGRLKELVPGDSVIFTDVEGNAFTYAVAECETLRPTAVEDMKTGNYGLTLFTCTIGGKTRVTIRCEKTD